MCSSDLEWVGPVFDAAGLSARYQESRIFVYPSVASHGEASPLAPLEAMAEGCPALVSDLECFRDYVSPGRNGWTFDHRGGNPARNLARVLKEILARPDALADAGALARQTALNFSLAEVSKKYLTDFEEVVRT